VVLDRVTSSERARLISSIRRSIKAPVPIDVFVTDLAEYERRKDIVGSTCTGRHAKAKWSTNVPPDSAHEASTSTPRGPSLAPSRG